MGQLVGRRGLEWRISCAGANPLAKTSMITGPALPWTDFSVAFAVPGTGCRAAINSPHPRPASEQLVSGSIWYDKLQIVRAQ